MQTAKSSTYPVINKIKEALVVSCQASTGEPLNSPEHLKALALSAIMGGAKALRLEGVENIKAIRKVTELPIVGITKSKDVSDKERLDKVYITASFIEAESLAEAGSDIIALDATNRPRADKLSLEETISRIHKQLAKPVWADVSTFEEGVHAHACGADIISTTLFGYTKETELPFSHGPGLELLKKLVEHVKVPIILEGRVWYPEEVKKAFEYGAYAVVVGSAITRPQLITERFVRMLPNS